MVVSTLVVALVVGPCPMAPALAARQGASPASTHCAATPLQKGRFPRPGLETLPWLAAAPASTGITGHLFFATVPTTRYYRVGRGKTAAALYTHGTMPGGGSTKVLWVISNPRAFVLGPLTINGRNIAGSGTMHQIVPRASGSSDYPSIVTIPALGCWQLRLRIASDTGARVVRGGAGRWRHPGTYLASGRPMHEARMHHSERGS